MAVTIFTEPTIEPVTIAEQKAHSRVSTDADDLLLAVYIAAARQNCESFQGRAYITQTIDLTLDDFPCDGIIYFPRAPLASVTSITYVDENGTTQTLSATLYTVDTKNEPGRIYPSYGNVWPIVRSQPNAVTVRAVCGYGTTTASVPARMRAAMMLLAGNWYENREPVITGTIVAELPMGVARLLWPDRVSIIGGVTV
jgi:uncharacterized phiE125 gp8 family phage protein